MSILNRIFNFFGFERGNYSNPGGPLYSLYGFYNGEAAHTEADELVSVKRGLKTNVAFSCINVLAQTVASLPYNVRRDTPQGKEVVKNVTQYGLIHTRPNTHTTAFNFWYNMVANMLSHGNAYALIERNINGLPIGLHICDPQKVKAELMEGEVFYKIGHGNETEYIHQDLILHLKLYSYDGICGVSPIMWNAESFGYRLKLDKYKSHVIGSKPSGVLSFSQEMTDKQFEQSQESWNRMKDKAGTPVLSGGAKYHPMMIPPNEGQMIEASRMNQEEICGIFRVPPTFIQNYESATFSNAEQQDLVMVKHALTPLLKAIEQEVDYKLFNSRSEYYTKFNIKGLLRGDIKTQSEWYRMLRSFGLASANEIRAMEDMSKLEGDTGDMVLVQGAMIPLDQLREFYSNSEENQERQAGFTLQEIKAGIDRLETMNNHEG